MKFARFAVVGMALVAGVAFAGLNYNIDNIARWVKGGLYVMPASISAQVVAANGVTRMLGGSTTFDFPSNSILCADATGLTVTGAQLGDPCFVGAPAALAANSSFTCYVSAANTVVVRHCPVGTVVDPASALYFIRVVSSL